MSESQEQPPEVYKVIGAPGTGKTTRVVGNPEIDNHTSLVQQNIDKYSWDEQMIVTYTKAGTEEAAERLKKILDEPKYKIDDRVRTIHSMCYETLGVEQDQVVNHYDRKKFCDRHGLEYGWDDDDDDLMAGDAAEGNALMDIYGWLKSNRKDLSEWEDCPAEWPGHGDPEGLMNQWEEFKESRNLISFTDMIEDVVELGFKQLENLGWGELFVDENTTAMEMFKKARNDPQRDPEIIRGKGAFIDTKVLYVDEVQDLTPLQWCWYLLQKLVCEEVYIGGDDDQTIYGWAGANPDFMLNEEGGFEVLDKTYRIPAEIWDTCDGVIRQVDHRQEKDVTPDGDGGEVVTLHSPSPRRVMQHADGDSVFILFRARYHIDEFRDKLHQLGIPYRNNSTYDIWEDDLVTLRDALYKFKNGADKISGDELQALKDFADDEMINKNNGISATNQALGNLGGLDVEEVEQMFDISTKYGDSGFNYKRFLAQSDEVNYYQKEAVIGNLEQGDPEAQPDRIEIGTIHSSKGKEAETVILATDSTKTIMENMHEDTLGNPNKNISDAERRVLYVGMTRASEKLVLVQGAVSPDTALDLEDLLADYEREDEWKSGRQSYQTQF